jgi:hypothetical protein
VPDHARADGLADDQPDVGCAGAQLDLLMDDETTTARAFPRPDYSGELTCAPHSVCLRQHDAGG